MMTRIWAVVMATMIMVSSSSMAQAPLIYKGRLAISHDGNAHDNDDIGASAWDFAICWAFGVQSKVVHFDYGDHLGDNNPSQDKEMQASCTGGPKNFPGFDASKVFNDQGQLSQAIANFKAQAEKSGPGDTLAFICAGPMEVPWRCMNATNADKRKFIKVIQHGAWNMNHTGAEMTHDWSACLASFPDVNFVKISDQNANLGGGSNWGFLSSMPKVCGLDPAAWVWLKSRDKKSGDVSDCGMTWYTLTGSQKGAPADFEKRFKDPICKQSMVLILRAGARRSALIRDLTHVAPYYSIAGQAISRGGSVNEDAMALRVPSNGRKTIRIISR